MTRIEAALHTYVAVSDIEGVTLSGLEDTEYLDKVEDSSESERAAAHPVHSGDRPRLSRHGRHLFDRRPGMEPLRTVIAKRGSAATVVWNPWDQRSRTMSDMGPDVWRGMLMRGNRGGRRVSGHAGPR